MDDNNEMESLMSNEEDKTLGMYQDALSYRTLISLFGSHTRMCT